MSNIKYIDYDCSDVDNVIFDNKISTITSASYRIDKRSLIVNYPGSVKDLYTNPEPLVKDKHILIFDITNYYGFHNSELWDWINAQRGVNGNG